MSKTKLGQKSLGLTVHLFLGTGLVLSLTQALDEDSIAGKSTAELRQQAWTQEVFAGNLLKLRGSEPSFVNFDPTPVKVTAGSVASRFTAPQNSEKPQAFVKIAQVEPRELPQAPTDALASNQSQIFSDAENNLNVNRSNKRDRRVGWGWEPYKVSHGRKNIALNWSGTVWSMNGPFARTSNAELPKLPFAPSDDLVLVMADASQFLKQDVTSQAPTVMLAQNNSGANAPTDPVDQGGLITGSTALAYAPTSVEAMEEPFKAILTEQRSGKISEDNRVTILGAVEDLNEQLSGKPLVKKSVEAEKIEKQVATLAPISALPRPRAAFSSKQNQLAKVSQPLDVSPVVANLQAREQKELAEKTSKTVETANTSASQEGLTLAKSKARRAKLQLASLSGKAETKNKKKSRFASWFSFGSSGNKKKAKIVTKGEHAWVANKLPKSSYTKKQRTCLANAIYFEARSEPEKGQIAVAQVVANRVKNPTYPNSMCGVVYQNKHKRNACQFSFACDRIPDRIRSKKAWDTAWKLANQVIDGEVWLTSIGSATHYHATYVRPKWARTMKKRKKIGLHIFYKTYGGGWS